MKLYKTNYDFARPSMQKLTIPADSDIAIGFEIYKNGSKVDLEPEDVTLTDGTNTLSCTTTYADMPCMKYSTVENADDKQYDVNVNKQPKVFDTGVTGRWAEGAYDGLEVSLSSLLGKTVRLGDLQKEFYCEANPALSMRDYNLGTISQHVGSSWNRVAWITGTYIMALNPSTGVAEYVDSFTFDAESEYVFRAGTIGTAATDGYAYTVKLIYGKPITGSFPLQIDVNENLPVEIDDAQFNNVDVAVENLSAEINEMNTILEEIIG